MEGAEILTIAFDAWLLSKKLNPKSFKEKDPECFFLWEKAFEQMHPESFLMRFKFQINAKRRSYPLPSNPE